MRESMNTHLITIGSNLTRVKCHEVRFQSLACSFGITCKYLKRSKLIIVERSMITVMICLT